MAAACQLLTSGWTWWVFLIEVSLCVYQYSQFLLRLDLVVIFILPTWMENPKRKKELAFPAELWATVRNEVVRTQSKTGEGEPENFLAHSH